MILRWSPQTRYTLWRNTAKTIKIGFVYVLNAGLRDKFYSGRNANSAEVSEGRATRAKTRILLYERNVSPFLCSGRSGGFPKTSAVVAFKPESTQRIIKTALFQCCFFASTSVRYSDQCSVVISD